MAVHPMVVHFPIALLIVGVAFDLAARFGKREHLRQPASYLLGLGLAGAAAAWLTGNVAAEHAERLLPDEGAIQVHRAFATLAVLLFGVLLAVRRRAGAGYLVLAALALTALVLAGRTGGEMVYGDRGMISQGAGGGLPAGGEGGFEGFEGGFFRGGEFGR